MHKSSNSPFKGFSVISVEKGIYGEIWVGGGNGGLFRIENGEWEWYYSSEQGDKLLAIENLRVASNGDVWFISNRDGHCTGCRKLFRYDGNKIENISNLVPYSLHGYVNFDGFEITTTSELWLFTGSNVVLFDRGEVVDSLDKESLSLSSEEEITHIGIDEEDRLWIAIRSISSVKSTRFAIYKEGIIENLIVSDSIYCNDIVQSEAGKLWYSFYDLTSQEYIFGTYDEGNWNLLDKNNFPSNFIYPKTPKLKYVDVNDRPWFSVAKGKQETFFKLDSNGIVEFSTKMDPLSGLFYNDMAINCSGDLWVISYLGAKAIEIFDGSVWNPAIIDQVLSHKFGSPRYVGVHPVTCDIWILDHQTTFGSPGLVKFDGTEYEEFYFPQGDIGNNIEFDSKGNLWVASHSSGLGKYSNGGWSWFTKENSPLVSNYINKVQIDSKDRIWMSTWGYGLYSLYNGEWSRWTAINSPVPATSFNIHVDDNDILWICTTTHGTHTYNAGNWEFAPIPGLEAGFSSCDQDKDGNYWFSASKGVINWNGEDVISYTIENSDIGSNGIIDIIIDAVDTKYFLFEKGVSILKSDENPDNENFGTFFLTSEILVFPNPGKDIITFEFPRSIAQKANIYIYDLFGRTVAGEFIQPEDIRVRMNLGRLTAGIYFPAIKYANGQKVFLEKLIIQR